MKTKIAFAALGAALLLSPSAMAGESEMSMPLPTINVWAAGKRTLSVFGGLGSTGVSFTPSVAYGELAETAEYEDDDITLGLRYAFPVGESLTLEAGLAYNKGSLELSDPFAYTYEDSDAIRHDVSASRDEQDREDLSISFGGLYSLATSEESPIHGGIFFLAEGGKYENTWDAAFAETIYQPGQTIQTSFDGEVTEREDTRYGVKLGLTADVHVIRDVLRVTPMVGYYYRWVDTDAFVGLDDEGHPYYAEGISDSGGGALYGIEMGYRPGGAEGKWEIVLTPYFKTEPRRTVFGQKIEDHRNAVVLTFRSHF